MKISLFAFGLLLIGRNAISSSAVFPYKLGDKWLYSSYFHRYMDRPTPLSGTSLFEIIGISSISDTSYNIEVDVKNMCTLPWGTDTLFHDNFAFEWSESGTKKYTNGFYFEFLNSCGGSDSCNAEKAMYTNYSRSKYSERFGTVSMHQGFTFLRFFYINKYSLISYNGIVFDSTLGVIGTGEKVKNKAYSYMSLDGNRLKFGFRNRQINGKIQ